MRNGNMMVLMKCAKPGACPYMAESGSCLPWGWPTGSTNFNGDVHQEAENCEERTICHPSGFFFSRLADEFGSRFSLEIARF